MKSRMSPRPGLLPRQRTRPGRRGKSKASSKRSFVATCIAGGLVCLGVFLVIIIGMMVLMPPSVASKNVPAGSRGVRGQDVGNPQFGGAQPSNEPLANAGNIEGTTGGTEKSGVIDSARKSSAVGAGEQPNLPGNVAAEAAASTRKLGQDGHGVQNLPTQAAPGSLLQDSALQKTEHPHSGLRHHGEETPGIKPSTDPEPDEPEDPWAEGPPPATVNPGNNDLVEEGSAVGGVGGGQATPQQQQSVGEGQGQQHPHLRHAAASAGNHLHQEQQHDQQQQLDKEEENQEAQPPSTGPRSGTTSGTTRGDIPPQPPHPSRLGADGHGRAPSVVPQHLPDHFHPGIPLDALDAQGGIRPWSIPARPPLQVPGLMADPARQAAVKEMFQHSWKGYCDSAWGKDTLKPVSRRGDDNFLGMGITILDALDTMWIMGMHDEFDKGAEWVLRSLHFNEQENINLFETTIRVLGGLLSAFDLSGRPAFLDKARELADALSFGFDSPSGVPYGTLGLRTKKKFNPSWVGSQSTMAEAATLQLEWEYLAAATGQRKYADLVRRVMRVLRKDQPQNGLFPIFINPSTGRMSGRITLGARGDSTFEYLVKQWVLAGGLRAAGALHQVAPAGEQDQTGTGSGAGSAQGTSASPGMEAVLARDGASRDSMPYEQIVAAAGEQRVGNPAFLVGEQSGGHPQGEGNEKENENESESEYFASLRRAYDCSADGIHNHLLRRTKETNLLYIAEKTGSRLEDKMDHLACFAGGMYALGAQGRRRSQDVRDADGITETCHEMYKRFPTGLAPEIVRFPAQKDLQIDAGAKHSLLRPETAESYFYMWRLTGEQKWRDYGWELVEALNKHARVSTGGFSSLVDVSQAQPRKKDHMESFFLAETLKYLYLLFSDGDLVPLDRCVFNTEAHPLSIFGQGGCMGVGEQAEAMRNKG